MKDILIVCNRQEYFNSFISRLGHLPVHYSWAADIEEALSLLAMEKPFLVILWHDHVEMCIRWIERCADSGIPSSVVCLLAENDWETRKVIWKMGVRQVITLPVITRELEYMIRTLIREGEAALTRQEGQLSGRLEDFNLMDLIQSMEETGRSGRLLLEKQERSGEIYFNQGRVVHARYGKNDPLQSVIIMSTWFDGRFTIVAEKDKYPEKIVLENRQVILECLNYNAKREELLKSMPPRDHLLFAPPDMDYEEIGPTDRKYILQFKNGYTLRQFLEDYTGNSVQMLNRVKRWLENKWLISQTEYDDELRRIQTYENMSGFKKLLNKVFAKKSQMPEIKPVIDSGEVVLAEEEVSDRVLRRPHLFTNGERLLPFLETLEASGD